MLGARPVITLSAAKGNDYRRLQLVGCRQKYVMMNKDDA
jgi:hypothetical protein